MRGAGRLCSAPIVLLETERGSEIAGLMQRDHGDADLTRKLCKHGIDLARTRARCGTDARDGAVQLVHVHPKFRIDLVANAPRVGMPRKFLGSVWPRIAWVQVLHVALLHSLQAKRQVTPGKMRHDVVEPSPLVG